jgi:hypothetical protein
MAHINRVLRSIETDDGGRCVDLFVRPDGSFGFEEYRRDSEDRRGWFPIGGYAAVTFITEAATLAQALICVLWLRHSIGDR